MNTYYTVVTKDSSSPIGYHPIIENGRFNTLAEAFEHRATLEHQHSECGCGFMVIQTQVDSWDESSSSIEEFKRLGGES